MLKDGTNKDYNCVCIYIPKKITPDDVLKARLVSQTGWCVFLQENKMFCEVVFYRKNSKSIYFSRYFCKTMHVCADYGSYGQVPSPLQICNTYSQSPIYVLKYPNGSAQKQPPTLHFRLKIIEWFRLEKTLKIIESNHKPTTAKMSFTQECCHKRKNIGSCCS